MGKKFLPIGQKMNAATFVEIACAIAADLEDREIAMAGSRPIARQRVSNLANVPVSLLRKLRYRPPKTIAADAFDRLCAAVECQAEREIRKLENEVLKARACRRGMGDRDLWEIEDVLESARALLKKKE